MEAVMFMCAILQKYELQAVGELPQISDAHYGLTNKLPPFHIKAVPVETHCVT